jgi:hypothetical protein
MSAGRGKAYVLAAPQHWGRVKRMVNARRIADRIESPHRHSDRAVVGGAR